MTMSESVRSDDVPNAANPGTDTGESVEGSNATVNTPALQARLNAITAANPKLLMAQEALITLLAPANPKFVALVLDLPSKDLPDLLHNMRLCAIGSARDIYVGRKKPIEAIKQRCNILVQNALGLQPPDPDSVCALESNPLLALAENEQKEMYARIARYVCAGHPNFGIGNVLGASQDASHPQYPNPLSAPADAFYLQREFQWFDTGSIRNGGFPERLSPDVLQVAHFLRKEHGDCNRSTERDFTWYRAVLVHTCLVALEQLPSLTEEENEIFDSALRRYLEGKKASSTDASWRDYLENYTRMQKEFDVIANSLARTAQQDDEPSATPISTSKTTNERSTGQNRLPDFLDLKTFILNAMQYIQDLSIITQVHEECRGQWSEERIRTVEDRIGNPSGDNKGLDEIIDAVLDALPDTYTEAFTAMKNYCTEREKARENYAAINKVYGI